VSAGIFDFIQGDEYNDAIEQGATWDQTFEYTDDAGAAINLTGYTARMQGRRSKDDTTTLFSLTSAAGELVLGGALGTVQILVSATATAAFDWDGFIYYDIELVNGTTVIRFMEGTAELSKEVTR
jgi:hypothetical protein